MPRATGRKKAPATKIRKAKKASGKRHGRRITRKDEEQIEAEAKALLTLVPRVFTGVIFLKSGDKIAGKIDDNALSAGFLLLYEPVRLSESIDHNGAIAVKFIPWNLYSDEVEAKFPLDMIASILEANDLFTKNYERYCSEMFTKDNPSERLSDDCVPKGARRIGDNVYFDRAEDYENWNKLSALSIKTEKPN